MVGRPSGSSSWVRWRSSSHTVRSHGDWVCGQSSDRVRSLPNHQLEQTMLSRADNTETGTLYPHRSSRDFRFLGIEFERHGWSPRCPQARGRRCQGIDTETLAGFGLAAMMANDNDLIRSSPPSAGRHPACGLALRALHAQLPRRRGSPRRARARYFLRNRSELSAEVRTGDRAAVRRCRPPAGRSGWHLDEMVVRIAGKRMYPLRAVYPRGRGSRHVGPEVAATAGRRCG